MLIITIPGTELFDQGTETFLESKEATLKLEHSLISISKWESIWKKPFLGSGTKSREETISYVKCMTISPSVDDNVYNSINNQSIEVINSYIENSMTATTFNKATITSSGRTPTITSELIYYWMVVMNIPFDCEKWHLNRLLTLINIYDLKNGSKKKMSRKEIFAQQRLLNEKRKAELNTKG